MNDEEDKYKETIKEQISNLLEIIGVSVLLGLIAAPVLLFGSHCLEWLKSGEWKILYTSDFFNIGPKYTDWVGLNKVLVIFFDLPLALHLLILPIIFVYIWNYYTSPY